MPVPLQAESQYQKDFRWSPEFLKSATMGNDQELAGGSSVKLAKSLEPPLQRKKRTTFEKPEDEEYMLLGSQSKFAPSIIYRSRRAQSEPRKSFQPVTENYSDEDDQPPKTKPAPIVKVDTGAIKVTTEENEKISDNHKLQLNKEKKDKRGNKVSDERVARPPKRNMDTKINRKIQTNKISLTSENVRQYDQEADDLAVEKSKNYKYKRDDKILHKKKSHHQTQAKPYTTKKKILDTQTRYHENNVNNNRHPSPQHNRRHKHHVEDGDNNKENKYMKLKEQPADMNYAMKYKAGIAPKREKFQRLSEYQRQFNWKIPINASPLLSAEKNVFKSDDIFKPVDSIWEKEHYDRVDNDNGVVKKDGGTSDMKSKKKSKSKDEYYGKLKRSNSDSMIVVQGSSNSMDRNDKPNVKKSEKPFSKLYNRKSVNIVSEYDRNFKAPQRYDFENGCWKTAFPRQADEPTSWFQEVLELRKLAEQYRNRSYGSATPSQNTNTTTTIRSNSNLGDNNSNNGGDKLEDVQDVDSNEDNVGVARQRYKQHKINEYVETPTTITSDAISVRSMQSGDDDGRIPTPELKLNLNDTKKDHKKRHHLDRTTPAVGGALLVSRPKEKSKETAENTGHHNNRFQDKAVSVDLSSSSNDRASSIISSSTITSEHIPINANNRSRNKSNYINDNQQQQQEERHQHIPKAWVDNWSQIPRNGHKTLSVSSMASSCSLASSILERSKQRKENFWSTKNSH